MSDVIWSDRDWSRGMVRRLLGSEKKPNASASNVSGYTRLTARNTLERRGIAKNNEESMSRKAATIPSELPSVPLVLSVKPPPNVPSSSRASSVEDCFLALKTEAIDTLEALLDWTLLCTKASSAFLLDAQGFIVERVGKWQFDLAEATGTQVLLAMERLGKSELTETTLRSLNVEFEDHWLTAIPLPAGHDETYTLCLVTAAAMTPGLLRHVGSSVSEVILRV